MKTRFSARHENNTMGAIQQQKRELNTGQGKGPPGKGMGKEMRHFSMKKGIHIIISGRTK